MGRLTFNHMGDGILGDGLVMLRFEPVMGIVDLQKLLRRDRLEVAESD